MTNIRDIAKMAKVSVTTVSRVLNKHPYVSEEKREAVLNSVKTINHHKNINKGHLSVGNTYGPMVLAEKPSEK